MKGRLKLWIGLVKLDIIYNLYFEFHWDWQFSELKCNNSTNQNEIKYIFLIGILEEMALQRKGVRTIISREDQQLFRINYPFYDPLQIKDITIHLGPAQRFKRDQLLATIHFHPRPETQNNNNLLDTQSISISKTGVIEQIGPAFEQVDFQGRKQYHLKNAQKKGSILLFQCRECDHYPKKETYLSGNILLQPSKKKQHTSLLHICQSCQEVINKYYQKQQIPISFSELLRVNPHIQEKQMRQLQWSIIVNQQFTENTSVAKVNQSDVNVGYLAKASFLLNFQEHARSIVGSTVVMKVRKAVCRHDKVLAGRCQFCLSEIHQEHLQKYFSNSVFQDNCSGVKVSNICLAIQQQNYVNKILKEERAIIILDLDNTILHSHEISDLQESTILKLEEFYIIPKMESFEDRRKDLLIVKMRPFFKHFLYEIVKRFDIFVYTKGTRLYAEEICKYIRAQYADQPNYHTYQTWETEPLHFLKHTNNFKLNKVISRLQDPNLDLKDIRKLLPNKTSYHLILDDRRQVWQNCNSWYFTRDYYYFNKRPSKGTEQGCEHKQIQIVSQYISTEQNLTKLAKTKEKILQQYREIKPMYPQKHELVVETNDRGEYFLLFAAYALKRIHKYFFEYYKKEKSEEGQRRAKIQLNPLQSINAPKKTLRISDVYIQLKYIMRGYKIKFFLGENQTEDNNNVVRRAKKMGAIIVTNSEETPKLVIRANNLMKQTRAQPAIQNIAQTLKPNEIKSEMMSEQHEPVQISPQNIYYYEQKKLLNELFNNKIPVISQSWIHACYEYNYLFPVDGFRLFDPFKVDVIHEDYAQPIQQAANAIRLDIQQRMKAEIHPIHTHHIKRSNQTKQGHKIHHNEETLNGNDKRNQIQSNKQRQ